VATPSTDILRRDMADGPGARRSRERVVSPLRPVTYPAGTRSRARRTPPEVACTRSGGPTFYRLPQGFDRINEGLGRLPIDHVPGSFDPDHRGTLDLVTSTSVAAFASRCHYPASRSTRSRGCAMACLDGADNLLLGAATLHDAFSEGRDCQQSTSGLERSEPPQGPVAALLPTPALRITRS